MSMVNLRAVDFRISRHRGRSTLHAGPRTLPHGIDRVQHRPPDIACPPDERFARPGRTRALAGDEWRVPWARTVAQVADQVEVAAAVEFHDEGVCQRHAEPGDQPPMRVGRIVPKTLVTLAPSLRPQGPMSTSSSLARPAASLIAATASTPSRRCSGFASGGAAVQPQEANEGPQEPLPPSSERGLPPGTCVLGAARTRNSLVSVQDGPRSS